VNCKFLNFGVKIKKSLKLQELKLNFPLLNLYINSVKGGVTDVSNYKSNLLIINFKIEWQIVESLSSYNESNFSSSRQSTIQIQLNKKLTIFFFLTIYLPQKVLGIQSKFYTNLFFNLLLNDKKKFLYFIFRLVL
jgi:hypothetical protein